MRIGTEISVLLNVASQNSVGPPALGALPQSIVSAQSRINQPEYYWDWKGNQWYQTSLTTAMKKLAKTQMNLLMNFLDKRKNFYIVLFAHPPHPLSLKSSFIMEITLKVC